MHYQRIFCTIIIPFIVIIIFTILFYNRPIYLMTFKQTFISFIPIKFISTDVKEKSETYFLPNKNSCVIILKQAVGRLGNLMFKFASAYGLARFHRCRFYLDEPYMKILNATFTINITFLNIFKWEYLNLTNIVYRDNTACHYSQKLMLPNSIRYLELTGYWQAYRYFINYTDELRQQFTFRSNIIQTIAPFILQELKWRTSIYRNQSNITLGNNETIIKDQLELKNKLREFPFTLVGIHWRRGDMLRPDKQAYGHTVSSFIYLKNAMNYFLQKYTNVLFIVTSDDKNYCKNIFSNNSRVILTPDKFTGEQDLAMLTVCQHTIVTSGSFGWFAGYLAGGDIIYDKLSPTKNSGLERDCPPSQYYPPQFIPMKR